MKDPRLAPDYWKKRAEAIKHRTPEQRKAIHDALCRKMGHAILREGDPAIAQTYLDAAK